jgi:hypothetical protein
VIAVSSSINATTLNLSVLTGLHAGVSVQLDEPMCRIGSDLACDIVLTDAGMSAQHVMLHLLPPHVVIEAYAADVFVGHTHVPQGTGYRCLLPVKLKIADVDLHISCSSSSTGTSALRDFLTHPRIPRNYLLVIAALFTICMVVAFSFEKPPISVEVAPAESVIFDQDPALPLAPSANAALHAKLAEAGLSALHVEGQEAYLRVSGELTSEMRPRWEDIQQWFDRTYGATHFLENTVSARVPAAAPRIRIQAVWLGESPYVIGERGERLYPGAAMKDGWILLRIEARQLVFKRNDTEYTFTL